MVRGAARMTVNEQIKIVHEYESIYIPIGAAHRMQDPAGTDRGPDRQLSERGEHHPYYQRSEWVAC